MLFNSFRRNANLLGKSRCAHLAIFRYKSNDFLPTFYRFLPTFCSFYPTFLSLRKKRKARKLKTESDSIGRGGEVLQGEQSVPASGAPVVGQRNEGGAVHDDVQGGGQNGTPQGNQQVSEPVGETDNLSSSEIPNNQSVAEGDAPGQSGVDPRNMSYDERAKRGDMLRNAPAIDVNEGVITSTKELSARKAAEKWWDENVAEPAFYDTEIGEVEISRNSVESSLAHRYGQAKLDALTSLIEGFENAVYLGSMPDGARHGGVMNHYFAYPINYKGERCYVFCRAMHDANKNRLYVHEVFIADRIKKGDTLQTAASQLHGGIALYKDILANVLDLEPTSASEDRNSVSNSQENTQKSGENTTLEQIKAELKDLRKKIAVNGNKLRRMLHMSKYEQLTADLRDMNSLLTTVTAEQAKEGYGIDINKWDEVKYDALWAERDQLKQQIKAAEERLKNAESRKEKEENAPGQSGVYADNQGNPVDADGKLIVDEVNSIDEITDEDFETPTRNVQLPAIPENVANAIGTNGRPVVIKRNVFEKNGNTHVELEPEDSRNILRSALYNPNLVGSTQPIRRPDYKVAIRTGEQNAVVVLDVYQEKDFVEIVGWRMVNEKGLAKMQRQAEREGGQFLILSPNDGSAAALSALPLGLSSASEDRNSVSNSQENTQKSGEIAENAPEIQEPRSVEEMLDNGDKRITNYNSRGEVATVAIERDGKVVSVDSYDEGVLFEHTEYDGNGKATSVTRYDKQGNVVGTQVYEDGKAKTPMQKLADRILDRTEEKRRIPLRERARELEAQVGVKANIIESFDEVKNREARERIAAGEPVAGWYSGGQVYLYMPNIKDKREIELTYVHEVVAHHGVKKLLGERFNEFLDGVWNMMSEADRARMLAYVGANENATLQDMRAAADEYVAELAEKMNLGELEQSTWEKIVDWFKELLENIGFENLTKDDIESMLKASYSNLRAESGIRFRKKDSERRQEKNRINNAIDTAAGFVTVGGKRQAIKNRLKREAERKELAKEIYSSVLKGDFNDVTLSQIDKFIEDATPANPFGRRISQRLPQRMERALRAYERTNAVDALFSRISESAVPANERFSEAGRREIEERKKELLKGWAIVTGNWHTDLKEFTDDTEPIGEGQDSKVYSAKEGPFVIKASKGKPYGKRFRPDIDNIALFNDVFRNSRYEILGYGEIDGDFVRILKQRAVDFSNSTPLAVEERVEYMKSLGFEPINKDNTAFSNGEIVIADLQKSNIVRDVEGDIRVIDADAKLHTKDVGGDYTYPPVEEDLPEDSSTRFRKVTPEMDAEYMAAVENGDMETAERLVKEAAKLAMPDTKVVDEDGYPMVVYHGSEEDFNVFDKTKGRANMDIQGMFFSPWDDDARGYGSNVRAFYLNITKPANESTGYKALNKFQGQNGAGIKAREYLVSAGYDGVNNEDQEFVAFDPNQIKSADAVTYDDNGNVIPLSERFNEEKEDIRFRRANKNQEVFVSNAQRAVEGIKQEKATPEQWIAMLKKNGGLKAGEEAWLGLEEWLNEKQGAVTKQEILDYIAQNRIQIEEVEYSENARFKGQSYYADRYNAGEADDVMPANDTRLNYTTDGLENKREIALVVPTVESWNASDEIHFGDAGNGRAVAWVRFGETTDSEGNRVLVIDEIQSKRHQEGREKGYKDDKLAELDRKLNNNARSTVEELDEAGRLSKERYDYIINKIGGEAVALDNELTELQQKAKELGAGIRNEEAEKQQVANLEVELEGVRNVRDYDRITAEIEEIKERMAQRRTDFDSVSLRMREVNTRIDELINNYVRSQRGAVDAAPFEKNWHELAMKRMLRLAAEEGFDKVAWTTGEQQAERYNIGTKINHIHVIPSADERYVSISPINGRIIETPTEPNSDIIISGEYKGKSLTEVYGKSLADKIMSVEVGADERIAGNDLRIGGEGMKGFYDRMLPSFVQKYTKKWGAKVGEVTMPSLEENNTMWSVDVTPEMQESVMQGQTMFRMGKKETAPETVSVQDEHLQTVVSSADGAKVLKDLDNAIVEYENDTKTKEKTFLGNLAKILNAKKHGSNSQYATFEAMNGKVFTIRLANHNAKTSTFDNHDESEGISIVVTAQDNNGITNDGNAHLVEFFYDAIKLRKADGKPLVEILKSIKQALYSGEYKDNTGLAEVQEVNSSNSQAEDARFRTEEEVIEQQEENEVSLARETVTSLGEKLNSPVRIIDDLDSVPENRRKWKGWFDPKTGEVAVVIPNHVSTEDAMQTVLHEVVGHKGLRAVLGEDTKHSLYIYNE